MQSPLASSGLGPLPWSPFVRQSLDTIVEVISDMTSVDAIWAPCSFLSPFEQNLSDATLESSGAAIIPSSVPLTMGFYEIIARFGQTTLAHVLF